jgi:signal transduction histidine kinase
VALASDVLKGRADQEERELTEPLARIAGVSRELAESMSDIVWAINPKRDRLGDVVSRMRRFGEDSSAAAGIEFRFDGPTSFAELRLGPNLRRQVYLVFKEAVNNALRHSGGRRLDARLRVDREGLALAVQDDGRGFDPAFESEGNGLESMRKRAREAGGRLDIRSRPGEGTRVSLAVPLARRGPWARLGHYMSGWWRRGPSGVASRGDGDD